MRSQHDLTALRFGPGWWRALATAAYRPSQRRRPASRSLPDGYDPFQRNRLDAALETGRDVSVILGDNLVPLLGIWDLERNVRKATRATR